MTKLSDYVDSAVTKGARRQAAQSRASMLTVAYTKVPLGGKAQIKTFHGTRGQKVTIRQKPGR